MEYRKLGNLDVSAIGLGTLRTLHSQTHHPARHCAVHEKERIWRISSPSKLVRDTSICRCHALFPIGPQHPSHDGLR